VRGLWLALALTLGTGVASAADTTQVERGRYLAIAGNCVSCHTRPGGEPFAGGLALQTPLGALHSTNITPDAETGIGRWSLDDFRRAMRQGIAADGSYLFPAFPYTAYTRMSDAEIADLYAWLRTLAPVRYAEPENGFAFSLRWAMAAWNALFLQEGPQAPDPARSAEWNRGEYLVNGPGHCGACHTPRNLLLAEDPVRALQGGTMTGEVAPGVERRWFAVNLRRVQHGLAAWTEKDMLAYFSKGYGMRGASFGPMNAVITNSLSQLRSEDQRAIAVYLGSLEGEEYDGPVVEPQLAAEGADLYGEHCAECHQKNGRGNFLKAPALAGNAVVQGEDPASLINVILHGPNLAQGLRYGAWEDMPSFGKKLDDAEAAALANYLRGSWGNRAAAVTTEQVAASR
jgi:alcohol dehydrogenase (quinone), cytochrome c subunit